MHSNRSCFTRSFLIVLVAGLITTRILAQELDEAKSKAEKGDAEAQVMLGSPAKPVTACIRIWNKPSSGSARRLNKAPLPVKKNLALFMPKAAA